MGKIIISTNSSLDGIVQDPDGQEGSERGGWFGRSGGADLDPLFVVLLEEALTAEARCWAGAATSGSPRGG